MLKYVWFRVVSGQMKISYGVRTIYTGGLVRRCAERASIIFRKQKKKIVLTLASAILLLTCGIGWATPSPLERAGGWMQPRTSRGYGRIAQFGGHGAVRQQQHQEHLPQWFRQHQYLSPRDQERALRNEPGFERLPPQEQQRLYNRLRQLNAMPPARRERTLERMEAFERLSPEQRQNVRSTMQRVTQMPLDRQRMMQRAFQSLTHVPPQDRLTIINSARFKSEFSYQEREMLNTLMSVQPYAP
jgi:hypothetical protein